MNSAFDTIDEPAWSVLLELAVIVSPCGATDDEKAAYPLMNKRQGVVTASVGDGKEVPTPDEMQQIMYAAKREYGRIYRSRSRRKKETP